MARAERIEVIDDLRGVAALGVVLYHYIGFFSLLEIPVGRPGAAVVWLSRYGYLGVPIFFVLSGFVIAMTASRYDFDPSTGCRFVLRRLVRIAPPYWLMIALIAGNMLAWQALGYFRNTLITPAQVLSHLVYAQNILGYRSLDVAYWTLCLEVQFYLVFAASAVLLRRAPDWARLGWFAGLTVGSAAVHHFGAASQAWFPSLWHQFGVGVLAYRARSDRAARVVLLVVLPIVAAFGLNGDRAEDATVVLTAVFLLYAGGGRSEARPRHPLILGLGRISYSLYLVHGFLGSPLSMVLKSRRFHAEGPAWVAVAVATTASIAMATIFHRLVETRGIAWSKLVRVGPPRAKADEPGAAVVPGAAEVQSPEAVASAEVS